MRKILLTFAICISSLFSLYSQSFNYNIVNKKGHPRLLLNAGEEDQLLRTIHTQPGFLKIHQMIIDKCDKLLKMPVVFYHIEAKRLQAGYECSERIFYLSYAYRITHDKKYLYRVEPEIKSLCSFPNWNPNHYLDTSTITMSLAIAYDWLYDQLSSELKTLISEAIVKKGFNSSKTRPGNWFYSLNTNWNSVCNAGLVYGALAIFDVEPRASADIIEKCMNTIHLPLQSYAPDGAYPEGYDYWEYGTELQVLLNAELENIFGTDNGLTQSKGFLESAYYMLHMVGPSGYCFNYSDCSNSLPTCNLTTFWFAKEVKDSSILWWEKDRLDRSQISIGRYSPLLLTLLKDIKFNKISKPKQTMWVGRGIMPVVLVRSGWKLNSIFFGIKGGLAFHSHAHMDAGSFVFDALGVRWAMDLRSQEYESLEKAKVDLFNGKQDGQRWKILRMNSLHHNTLTINGHYHDVNIPATIKEVIISKKMRGATIDLSGVLKADLKSATRTAVLINNKYLQIVDSLTANEQMAQIQWTMCTSATAKIVSSDTILLRQKGKMLDLIVDSPEQIKLRIWSNEPEHFYDAPNSGTVRVGFVMQLKPNEKGVLRVRLIPIK